MRWGRFRFVGAIGSIGRPDRRFRSDRRAASGWPACSSSRQARRHELGFIFLRVEVPGLKEHAAAHHHLESARCASGCFPRRPVRSESSRPCSARPECPSRNRRPAANGLRGGTTRPCAASTQISPVIAVRASVSRSGGSKPGLGQKLNFSIFPCWPIRSRRRTW